MRSRLRFLFLGLVLLLVMGTQVPLGRTAEVSYCAGQVVTIEGTNGDDVLEGTPGPDVIAGFGGDDLVRGLGGGDYLCGGPGADRLEGGDGNDRLFGEGGPDLLVGGGGNDRLLGASGDDELRGNSGHDRLLGGAGDDLLHGGTGNDWADYRDAPGSVHVRLSATSQNTMAAGIDTLAHVENVRGSQYCDHLEGDSAGNRIDTGACAGGAWGNDIVRGYEGDDRLIGYSNALIHPGPDDDRIEAKEAGVEVSYASAAGPMTINLKLGFARGQGRDELSGIAIATGGDHDDRIIGGDENNRLSGGAGDDELVGGGGRDTLFGGEGNDVLRGGPDYDRLNGGPGNDEIDGGHPGHAEFDWGLNAHGRADMLDYTGQAGPLLVDLRLGAATGVGVDTFTEVEGVYGSLGDDRLIGDHRQNLLDGGDGDDIIFGRARGDLLIGAEGEDLLLGQGGDDVLRSTGPGEETLVGGPGNDYFDACEGSATVSFASAPGAVIVDLSTRTAVGEGNDTLYCVQNLIGSPFSDFLTGDSGHNTINGGDGTDQIRGGTGNDVLLGEGGYDFGWGEGGLDRCVTEWYHTSCELIL